MVDEPTRDQNKFLVRMPDGMRDRLKAQAEANKRSMNAEIVARLEASLLQAERLRNTVYHGNQPLELDDEFFSGMMSLYERMREKHDAKYGVTPPESRRPIAFPVRVKEPEPLTNEELSEAQLQEGLEWLRQERQALEAEIQRRAKKTG